MSQFFHHPLWQLPGTHSCGLHNSRQGLLVWRSSCIKHIFIYLILILHWYRRTTASVSEPHQRSLTHTLYHLSPSATTTTARQFGGSGCGIWVGGGAWQRVWVVGGGCVWMVVVAVGRLRSGVVVMGGWWWLVIVCVVAWWWWVLVVGSGGSNLCILTNTHHCQPPILVGSSGWQLALVHVGGDG